MKTLIEFIAQSMVENPESVTVHEYESGGNVVIELSVDASDIGRIIGRKGKTASAMRALLDAMYSSTEKKYILEILEQ